MLHGLGQGTWSCWRLQEGAGEGDSAGCHCQARTLGWDSTASRTGEKNMILVLYEELVGLVERCFSFDTLCLVSSMEYSRCGVNWVTGGQCAVSSQPNWGTALDCRNHREIPKFLQALPGAGCPAWCWAVCQGMLRVPHTDPWSCFHQAGCTRTPLPEPTQV